MAHISDTAFMWQIPACMTGAALNMIYQEEKGTFIGPIQFDLPELEGSPLTQHTSHSVCHCLHRLLYSGRRKSFHSENI